MRVMSDLPYLDRIENCKSYVYFCRDWWDGHRSDVIVVGERRSGNFFCFCYAEGESGDLGMELCNRDITVKVFSKLMDIVSNILSLEVNNQETPLIMTHFDDHYLLNDGALSGKISVRCGQHLNNVVGDLLDCLLDTVPELESFYDRLAK